MRKDADLIHDAADASGTGIPAMEAARTWLTKAEAAGLGSHDYTAMLAAILGTGPATVRAQRRAQH